MKKNRKTSRKSRKRKRLDFLCWICWLALPLATAALLLLDGLGVYAFNTQRLLVMGAGVLILLIPFISEISIKNISIKKETD